MKIYPLCDPYVWENPKVLLSTGFFLKRHKEGPCVSEYVNALVLIFTLAFFIGTVLSVLLKMSQPVIISLAIASILSVPFIWDLTVMQRKEGFQSDSGSGSGSASVSASASASASAAQPVNPTPIYDVIGAAAPANLTLPNSRNPFMNVLIDEIKYNPTRPTATSITDPSTQVKLDDFFRTEFTADPTDVFGRSQSQRQFITMPSTTIPNDQNSYQNWLYKIDGKTCKEGGREACLPGTDGGALPWMNVNP